MMPGLDGGELANRLQASPNLSSVPIVFLTAVATKGEVSARGGQVGGLTFLAKPVELSEVMHVSNNNWVTARLQFSWFHDIPIGMA
jgi:CheY-like chemotaxis protein